MGSLKISIFIVASFLVAAAMSYGSCPPKNKVTNSSPVCHSDADCQKWGQVCCPNQFNTKSCTQRAPWNNYSSDKQPKLKRMGRAVRPVCKGVLCHKNINCKVDPITKKLKCSQNPWFKTNL